jgi:hypothetical protein
MAIFRVLACALMGMTLACLIWFTGEQPPSTKMRQTSELPEGWRLEDIDKAIPPYRVRGTTFVLAWKIVEDDRPLCAEQCLVLKHMEETDRKERWVLASVYRHPKLRNVWELSMLATAPDPLFREPSEIWHYQYLVRRPTNKDVYNFMDDVNWKLDADKGYRLVDGRVCQRAWEAGVGEKPTRSFRK